MFRATPMLAAHLRRRSRRLGWPMWAPRVLVRGHPTGRFQGAGDDHRASEQLAVIVSDNDPRRAGRFGSKPASRHGLPRAIASVRRPPKLGPEGRGGLKRSIRGFDCIPTLMSYASPFPPRDHGVHRVRTCAPRGVSLQGSGWGGVRGTERFSAFFLLCA